MGFNCGVGTIVQIYKRIQYEAKAQCSKAVWEKESNQRQKLTNLLANYQPVKLPEIASYL